MQTFPMFSFYLFYFSIEPVALIEQRAKPRTDNGWQQHILLQLWNCENSTERKKKKETLNKN